MSPAVQWRLQTAEQLLSADLQWHLQLGPSHGDLAQGSAPVSDTSGEHSTSPPGHARTEKLDFSLKYSLSSGNSSESGICPTITIGDVYAVARNGCVLLWDCHAADDPYLGAIFTSMHLLVLY